MSSLAFRSKCVTKFLFLLELSRFTLVGFFFNFLKDARFSFIAEAMAGVTNGFPVSRP